jgi:hypothetical protein
MRSLQTILLTVADTNRIDKHHPLDGGTNDPLLSPPPHASLRPIVSDVYVPPPLTSSIVSPPPPVAHGSCYRRAWILLQCHTDPLTITPRSSIRSHVLTDPPSMHAPILIPSLSRSSCRSHVFTDPPSMHAPILLPSLSGSSCRSHVSSYPPSVLSPDPPTTTLRITMSQSRVRRSSILLVTVSSIRHSPYHVSVITYLSILYHMKNDAPSILSPYPLTVISTDHPTDSLRPNPSSYVTPSDPSSVLSTYPSSYVTPPILNPMSRLRLTDPLSRLRLTDPQSRLNIIHPQSRLRRTDPQSCLLHHHSAVTSPPSSLIVTKWSII